MLEKTEPVPFLKMVDDPSLKVPAVDFARSSLPGERPTPFQRGELYLNTHFEGHSAADVLARVRSPQEYPSDDPIFKAMVDYPFSRRLLAKVLEAQIAINEGDPSRLISEKELEVEEGVIKKVSPEVGNADESTTSRDRLMFEGTMEEYQAIKAQHTIPDDVNHWQSDKRFSDISFMPGSQPVTIDDHPTPLEIFNKGEARDVYFLRVIENIKKGKLPLWLCRFNDYGDRHYLYQRKIGFDNELRVLDGDFIVFEDSAYRFNSSSTSISPLNAEETEDFSRKVELTKKTQQKGQESTRKTTRPTEPVAPPVTPPKAAIETPVVEEPTEEPAVEADEVALSNGDEVIAEVPAGNDTAALPTEAVTSSEIPEQKADSNELLDLEDDDAEEDKWEDFRGIRRARRRDGSKGRRNGKLRDTSESEEPVVDRGQVVAERLNDSPSATAPEVVEDSINLPGVALSNQNGEQHSVSLTNTDPEKPISVITMYGDGPTDHTIRTSDRITPVLNLDSEFPTYVEVDGTYYKLASNGNGFVTLTPREAQQLEAKILT